MKSSLIFLLLLPLNLSATYYVDCTATNGLNNGTSWSNAWLLPTSITGTTTNDTVYIAKGDYQDTTYWSPVNVNLIVAQDGTHTGMVYLDGTRLQSSDYFFKQMQNFYLSGNYQGSNYIQITNASFNGHTIYSDGTASTHVHFDHVTTWYGDIWINPGNFIEFGYLSFVCGQNQDRCFFMNVIGANGSTNYNDNSIHNCYVLADSDTPPSGKGSDFIQGGANMSVYSNFFDVYFTAFTETPIPQHQDCYQGSGPYIAFYDNFVRNVPDYVFYCTYPGTSGGNALCYNNVIVNTDNPSPYALGLACVGIVIGPEAGYTPYSRNTYSNIVVANNTFVDICGRSAIAMGMSGKSNLWTNVYVVNNLILDCGNAGGNGFPAFDFENYTADGGATWSASQALLAYNLIEAGRYGDVTYGYQSVTPSTRNPIRFISYTPFSTNNDYHISSNDLATAQGTNLYAQFPFLQIDKDGNARPSSGAWNIGAYQYASGYSGGGGGGRGKNP